MAEDIREVRRSTAVDGNDVVERREVRTNDHDRGLTKAQSLVYTLLGLLEGLLAIRFILALLGANTSNAFANLIYNITQPFVAPFQGLFNYSFHAGVSRFESETLVAMVVYGLVVWFILKLIGLGKRNPGV